MVRSTSRSHPAAMKPSRSRSVSLTRPIKRRRRWSLSVRHRTVAVEYRWGEGPLLAAVREGTEHIRSELREKMVEFATVMRHYSEEIAAKNRAYVEAARNTTDMISSHIEAVRAAMKVVAPAASNRSAA
jgi:hypothetical protein